MRFSKIQNMLLGIAIGDAFGAGYEFVHRNKGQVRDGVDMTKYVAHPKESFRHMPGQYTDDAQMSLGVAELLLSDEVFDTENLADTFVRVFKRDPIPGYSRGFQAILEKVM
ncbi:ADP-ribosylglycohydrolase family protein [Nanoarchaeota archaeon]